MPKKFLVDGRAVWVEEADFEEVREKFKENVTVDDMEKWETKEDMEKYTAETFLVKARHYLSLAPPDIMQSAEKSWFAAVYAVKLLYLTSGGVDLKSHNTLKFFVRFAIKHAEFSDNDFWHLHDCWTKAEKMHRDVYGSCNFRTSEYAQLISDVETFVHKFEAIDRKKLWLEFDKAFISGNNSDVVIRKESHSVNLGGYLFKCNYSAFV